MEKVVWKIWKYIGVAALLLTLSACDDNDNDIDIDDPDVPAGTFEGTITGDITAEIGGFAGFAEYVVEEEHFFVLFFATDQVEMVNLWLVRSGQFPGEGTYNIQEFDHKIMDDPEWFLAVDEFAGFGIRQENEDFQLFFSESGSVSMEILGQTTVAGDFDFSATGFMQEDIENNENNEEEPMPAVQVQFSGSFNAVLENVQPPVLQ